MKYIDEFSNIDTAKYLTAQIKEGASRLSSLCIMEVCGSHTMAISRSGIRSLLPSNIRLLSGPGCPVCVTEAGYVDGAIALAQKGVIITSFGDMLKVPGASKTLAFARSQGCDIRVCYSPSQAIEIAAQNPEKEVVFLAIGFETTMAPLAAVFDLVIKKEIKNFSLLTAFKLVPPALAALVEDPQVRVDAFLAPAHVSAIIGSDAYAPFVEKYKVPTVVCGFEPLDILYGIYDIVFQYVNKECKLVNQYNRVVRQEGNSQALLLINKYFERAGVNWRGIGLIPDSGMLIKDEYAFYDAQKRFNLCIKSSKPDPGCRCGDVLKGLITPAQCPLFSKVCTPINPVGPCMVSSEGSCAAYFKYER